ncbi:hypothetical protein E2C01_025301 [Portunus trituberculatus]|uniref:Uncharacterized protein n=1 Tax=Portunus trituberculatus TaxID=210409 RepID=A0A5B7EFE5_PORTR|nr:hypothetical protein [Portunus trituberculatus]
MAEDDVLFDEVYDVCEIIGKLKRGRESRRAEEIREAAGGRVGRGRGRTDGRRGWKQRDIHCS